MHHALRLAGVVADDQRVPVVAADLRVLAGEDVEALRVWVSGRAKVSETPLSDQPRRVCRWAGGSARGADAGAGMAGALTAGLLQHFRDGHVGVEQRRVRAIVATNRGVAEVLPQHQHGSGWRANLAGSASAGVCSVSCRAPQACSVLLRPHLARVAALELHPVLCHPLDVRGRDAGAVRFEAGLDLVGGGVVSVAQV